MQSICNTYLRSVLRHTSAYVSLLQPTSAYASLGQHPSAYVSCAVLSGDACRGFPA